MSTTTTPDTDTGIPLTMHSLRELLTAPYPTPRRRWAPGRMDFPEDADGECLFCHGSPGAGGCGECGARG